MRFLPEPLHKRSAIHSYALVPFLVLVLFVTRMRIPVTKLSIELWKIDITFQSYLFKLVHLLDYHYREFLSVSTEVNQWQQLLHMRKSTTFVSILDASSFSELLSCITSSSSSSVCFCSSCYLPALVSSFSIYRFKSRQHPAVWE